MSAFSRIIASVKNYILSKREAREIRRREEAEYERQREFLFNLGNDFEDAVISMFDPELFKLIHRTPRYDETHGRYVRGMELPDLRFKEKSTGRKFWVECKYRAHYGEKWTIEWCNPNQLRNYKKTMYRTHEPVLVIIGVGGTIKEPEHLYCLDLNRLNFTTLFYGTYKNNRLFLRPHNLESLLYIANIGDDSS